MAKLLEIKVVLDPGQLARISSDLLSNGFQIRFRAIGDSMQPTIRDGDVIVVKPAAGRHIRMGDLVMFMNSHERTVVHRVVAKKRNAGKLFFQTCGDNASDLDKPIERGQVTGIIKQILRDGVRVEDRGIRKLLKRVWYCARARKIKISNHTR